MKGEAEGQHRQHDEEGQRPDAVAQRAGQPAQQALALQHGGDGLQHGQGVRPAVQRQARRQPQRQPPQRRPGPAALREQQPEQPHRQHHGMQPQQADEGRHGVDAAPLAQHGARRAQAGEGHRHGERGHHPPAQVAPARQLGRQAQALAQQPAALGHLRGARGLGAEGLLQRGLVVQRAGGLDALHGLQHHGGGQWRAVGGGGSGLGHAVRGQRWRLSAGGGRDLDGRELLRYQ